MLLRAAPDAGKLSPPKLLPWVNHMLCVQQNLWTPKNTRQMKRALWKDARDNGVSNSDENRQKNVLPFHESGQGSPVTTWEESLRYRRSWSTNEAANHKHEHQTRYLLVAASKVYTKVHDNKVGVLTCPHLMWNKKPQICAPWKYLKARSQTTTETADSPIVIQK